MGMSFGDVLLALGMFISGTTNTIAAKWAQKTESEGSRQGPTTIWGALDGNDGQTKEHKFDHPFFQACVMFLGESLCLLAFIAVKTSQNRSRTNSAIKRDSKGDSICGNSLLFSLPAMLDMTGTGIMNAGLCLVDSSVFQMLRSAVVVFTALLSVIILKRRLRAFHWVAVVSICLGVFIVGYVAISAKSEEDDADTSKPSSSSTAAGVLLVIIAQAVVAFQMIVEEYVIEKYGAPALKAVGYEGVFGFTILGLLLIPLYYITVPYSGVDCVEPGTCSDPNSYTIEDARDALAQVANSREIQVSLVVYILSIAFFNFFGISVTKSMSASHRMVLDSLRTVAVLLVGVWLLGDKFHPEQLIGFFFLLLGTGMYNEIVKFPFLFEYDDSEPVRESFVESVRQDSRDVGDEGKVPLLANV